MGMQGQLAALGSVTGAITEVDGKITRLEAGSGDLWELEIGNIINIR